MGIRIVSGFLLMFHVFPAIYVPGFLLCRYLSVEYVVHGVHECSILGPNAMLK